MEAQVWNDASHTHVEEFQGRTVSIPPRGYVIMTSAEASTFIGQFFGDKQLGKKLRKVVDPEAFAKKTDQPIKHVCELTGKEFRTDAGFHTHQEQLNLQKAEVKNAKGNRSGGASRSKQ